MKLQRTFAATLLAVGLSVYGPLPASASVPGAAPAISASSTSVSRSLHASLHLEIGHGKAWLGQSLPVTLRAYFRHVEGVTLEGAPQLTSAGVFTSDLGREPHQSTEIVNGEPVLVATWTGTLTPSTAGLLDVQAELPVRVKYRDAAPQAPAPRRMMDEEAFEALAANPFDSSALDRLVQGVQGEVAPQGRLHEETATLRSPSPAIDVQPLPTADQPATFSGAVGRFTLRSSLSAPTAKVSEPITLRVTVEGSGDFDRVDLHGLETSDTWKAYPMSAKSEPAADEKAPHRKVFEQVLVPLKNGAAETIPPITLASFDPTTGHYETHATAPISVPVDGTAVPAASAGPTGLATAPPAPVDIAPSLALAPAPESLITPSLVRPVMVVGIVAPAFALLAAFAAATALRRRRAAGALRQAMRTAAARGNAAPFYRAAHDLIAERVAEKWGVSPSEVTVDLLHDRLGLDGDPLVDAFATDEALRFGRASVQMNTADLRPLCTSIERSLGTVSSLGGLS